MRRRPVGTPFAAQQKPCPEGWLHKSHLDQCYLIPDQKLSRSAARQFCNQKGGDLVTLKTTEEYVYVQGACRGGV